MTFTVAAVVQNGLEKKLSFYSQILEYKHYQQTNILLLFILLFYLPLFKVHNLVLMSKEY